MGFAIGIARGDATLGRIGFEGRFDYGAIGTVSNLAARLRGQAAAGQILISGRICGVVEELVEAGHRGELTLRGFHPPVEAFSVIGITDSDQSRSPEPGKSDSS